MTSEMHRTTYPLTNGRIADLLDSSLRNAEVLHGIPSMSYGIVELGDSHHITADYSFEVYVPPTGFGFAITNCLIHEMTSTLRDRGCEGSNFIGPVRSLENGLDWLIVEWIC